MIEVNPVIARQQASNICRANDELTMSQRVIFSEGTTVQGNHQAQAAFQKLHTSVTQTQALLNRDVQNIHGAVASFQRMDQDIQRLFKQKF